MALLLWLLQRSDILRNVIGENAFIDVQVFYAMYAEIYITHAIYCDSRAARTEKSIIAIELCTNS